MLNGVINGLVRVLEWKARVTIAGYDKMGQLLPMELFQQGIDLAQLYELKKVGLTKEMIEAIQEAFTEDTSKQVNEVVVALMHIFH